RAAEGALQTMPNADVRRHGGLGVVSFILGALSLLLLSGIVGGAYHFIQNGQQSPDTDAILTYGFMLAIGACLLGIVLGIAGAIRRRSKKVFPLIGIILCTIVILIIGGLIALGMRQGAG